MAIISTTIFTIYSIMRPIQIVLRVKEINQRNCGFMVNRLLLLIIIILEKDFLLGYLEVFVLKEMIHNKIPNG